MSTMRSGVSELPALSTDQNTGKAMPRWAMPSNRKLLSVWPNQPWVRSSVNRQGLSPTPTRRTSHSARESWSLSKDRKKRWRRLSWDSPSTGLLKPVANLARPTLCTFK